MTLQEAKSIARHLGLTLRQLRSGNYRVKLPRWKRNDGLLHEQSGRRRENRSFAHNRLTCRLEQSLIMNQPIDRLRCHFDLTLAEARLALHLVTGETLRSAAAKLSITYETARTSLKNIFRKTGTCRQAELVVVILTALPDCFKQPVT
jgi:DNA-binding CsgD family transcriptional regulator